MVETLLAHRPALPFTDAHGTTISHADGVIRIGDHDYSPVDALEHSAAVARAVREAAERRITNPNQTHPTEGA